MLCLTQGDIGLNAAKMVMQLVKDNRKIVDRITHKHIDNFIDLLRKEKVTVEPPFMVTLVIWSPRHEIWDISSANVVTSPFRSPFISYLSHTHG